MISLKLKVKFKWDWGREERERARACELEFEQTYHELKVWLNQFSDPMSSRLEREKPEVAMLK